MHTHARTHARTHAHAHTRTRKPLFRSLLKQRLSAICSNKFIIYNLHEQIKLTFYNNNKLKVICMAVKFCTVINGSEYVTPCCVFLLLWGGGGGVVLCVCVFVCFGLLWYVCKILLCCPSNVCCLYEIRVLMLHTVFA